MSEVSGVDHITILYSAEAARRIVDWLGLALGAGHGTPETPGPDPRFLWSGLGLFATLLLAFGAAGALAPLAPRVALPRVASPLVPLALLLVALVGAVLLLSGVDVLAQRGPFGWIPLAAGRDLFGFFALAGAILLTLGARRGTISSEGLRDPATWLVAGLLFAGVYVVVATLNAPFWGLFPAPHRAPWCVVATLLLLPYFAGCEWLLRGSGAIGLWLPAVGKLLTLIVVGVGAVAGLLPFVILLGMGAIALFFVFFELVAIRLARRMPNPWIPALFQAAFTATAFVSIFPYEG